MNQFRMVCALSLFSFIGMIGVANATTPHYPHKLELLMQTDIAGQCKEPYHFKVDPFMGTYEAGPCNEGGQVKKGEITLEEREQILKAGEFVLYVEPQSNFKWECDELVNSTRVVTYQIRTRPHSSPWYYGMAELDGHYSCYRAGTLEQNENLAHVLGPLAEKYSDRK